MLNVTANYTQTSTGSLSVQIGGSPAGGQYGHVTAGGSAALAGTLNVGLVNGFGPVTGDT